MRDIQLKKLSILVQKGELNNYTKTKKLIKGNLHELYECQQSNKLF